MSRKITDEEFDKFVANTDKILDMMVLKAEKEWYIFLTTFTVRKKDHPYDAWNSHRIVWEATRLDALSLSEYTKSLI